MKIIKGVSEVILDIPDNVNTIAVHSSAFKIHPSEFYSVKDGKNIPVMVISSDEKPRCENLVYNLYPSGAYIITPGKARYLNYVEISENEISNGYVVLERTNKKINGTPVFKVTNKEPEAILNGLWIRCYNDCEKTKINEIINAINYEGGYITNIDRLYLGFIVPKDKKTIIDYTQSDKRIRWAFWWDNKENYLKDKKYNYEDLKTEQII